MEEKILFENETILTDNNFKSMMRYIKLHHETKWLLIKVCICLFIIIRINYNKLKYNR